MQSFTVFNPDHYLNQQGSLFPYEPRNLSEIVWPSASKAGIPELDLDMQADNIPEPFRIWGDEKRSAYMPGTYAFYTEDYKFSGLWQQPDKLLLSGCRVAVEPNFSVRPRMPFPVAIYEIFRKRWLARYWQSQGIHIIVDMNVAPCYLALNLVGVPKGWRYYATRAHKGEADVLEKVYELCAYHAGTEPTFLVYGGADGRTQAQCKERGWFWFPEKMHTQRHERRRIEYDKKIAAVYSTTCDVL